MAGEGTIPDDPLTLVEVAHLSDTGRVRHHNEDRSLVTDGVLVVADGMGGAKAGEVAAQMAVDAVGALSAPFSAEDVRAAVGEANRAIRRLASDDPDKSGMGTTLTAAMMRGGRLDVVHVGDSRAYLWRDEALSQVTEDHSVVAELVRRGSITAEEAESHPHRNVITRALGADAEVEADTLSADVRDGDVVLLCSDGLSSYVSEADISAVLASASSLAGAARDLVAAANGAGGADNVTVVLARVGPASAAQPGDTMEAPLVADGGDGTAPTAVKVLGGLHGQTPGDGSAPASRGMPLFEAVPRRRSRLVPVLIAAIVLIAAVVGVGAWVSSRTYTLGESAGGTLQVAHGLPWTIFGRDLSSGWQDTDLAVTDIAADDAGLVSSTFRGQGEAVAIAARLVWTHGISQPPTLTAPEPAGPPAPATPETTPEAPGTTTAP